MTAEISDTNLAWQAEASCASLGLTSEDFYYEERYPRRSNEQIRHVWRLKQMCASCPVRSECRDLADRHRDQYGFWAGETAHERTMRWKAEYRYAVMVERGWR